MKAAWFPLGTSLGTSDRTHREPLPLLRAWSTHAQVLPGGVQTSHLALSPLTPPSPWHSLFIENTPPIPHGKRWSLRCLLPCFRPLSLPVSSVREEPWGERTSFSPSPQGLPFPGILLLWLWFLLPFGLQLAQLPECFLASKPTVLETLRDMCY